MNLNRNYWEQIRSVMRRFFRPGDTSVIGKRAELFDAIRAQAVDGYVGVYAWGTDCDGYNWSRVYTVLAYTTVVEKFLDDVVYGGADGPTYHSIGEPEKDFIAACKAPAPPDNYLVCPWASDIQDERNRRLADDPDRAWDYEGRVV